MLYAIADLRLSTETLLRAVADALAKVVPPPLAPIGLRTRLVEMHLTSEMMTSLCATTEPSSPRVEAAGRATPETQASLCATTEPSSPRVEAAGRATPETQASLCATTEPSSPRVEAVGRAKPETQASLCATTEPESIVPRRT